MNKRLYYDDGTWSEVAIVINTAIEQKIDEVLKTYKEVLDDADLVDVRYLILSSASSVELNYALDRKAKA